MARIRTGKVTFHGSYTSQILARRKEREVPGSYIIKRGDRYYVIKKQTATGQTNRPRRGTKKRISRRSANPPTLIYEKITRIEGTKGKASNFAGQRFYHNFKKPYPRMFGLSNGDLLITSRRTKS